MGIIDNIRNTLFGNSNNSQSQSPFEVERSKRNIAEEIEELVRRIIKINSFDSSIWNLVNKTPSDLIRMYDLPELQSIKNNLTERLSQLQTQSRNPNEASLQDAAWTGNVPNHMSQRDFNRFQDNSR